MAEERTEFKVDFAGGMFILGVFLLIILFWGKPDLHDDHLPPDGPGRRPDPERHRQMSRPQMRS